ncbi:hypothetical protein HMPREF1040_0913 [Megasphaera sp. UPII 135-E]|nr:hypothetical protein HMPREF1040_0913 [Megasphaera sp. UPII 135-E]
MVGKVVGVAGSVEKDVYIVHKQKARKKASSNFFFIGPPNYYLL